MKKNLAIITTAISAALALVFIILMLFTAFGGLAAEDFDNTVVKTLLFAFSGIFLADTVAALCFQAHKGVSKEVQVAATTNGNVKITQSTVKALIKKSISGIDGIKFRNCTLGIDETGVRLDLSVNYYGGKKTNEASSYLQALVSDVCNNELDLKLSAVNIRVIRFKSAYFPDPNEIYRRAAEIRKESNKTEKCSDCETVTANTEDDADYETEITTEESDIGENLQNILRQLSAESRQEEDNAPDNVTSERETVSEK